jgi:phosphate transport system protein
VIEGHTSRAFDGALAALHMRVIEMGGLVLDQVREAAVAYTEWDSASAERVLERERTVNDYDRSIDSEHLTLIARRQPMANDLRAIIAMSRAVAELERAGDEAKKIAQTVLRHGGRPGSATTRDARHLARLATGLLRLSVDAFDRLEPATAAQVIAQDQDLDAEYAAGLRSEITRTHRRSRAQPGAAPAIDRWSDERTGRPLGRAASAAEQRAARPRVRLSGRAVYRAGTPQQRSMPQPGW